MFGPYAITVEGRTLYGNVALKEHHLVRREDACFVLVAPSLEAAPVAPALADALAHLTLLPGTLVPVRLMAALRGAGLVAGEEAAGSVAVEDGTAGRSGNVGPAAGQGAGPGDGSDDGSDGAAPAQDSAAPWRVTALTLLLAQSCNLACTYCYGQEGSYGAGGLMDVQTARAAVDWLLENCGDADRVQLDFFGGEPLLDLPVLEEVVAYAREQAASRGKQVGFGITTNATLVDDEVAAYLAQERIEPLVSCDGPPEVHDRQRPFAAGGGSYEAVTAGVRRLQAAFPGLMGRATLCGDTDPFAVRRGLEEAGFARCLLTQASPVLLAEDAEPESPAQRAAAAACLLAFRRREVEATFEAIAERRLDAAAPDIAVPLLRAIACGVRRHTGCGLGRGMRALSVDGSLYPCHRFVGMDDACMGKLADHRADAPNDFHRAVVENLSSCRACWARHLCGGGCFYENRARTGDMHRPDPGFCRDMRTVGEDVIAGWCRLSRDDQEYVRELLASPSGKDTP